MIWLEIVSTLIACGFIIVVGMKCCLVVGGVVHTQVPVLNLRHNCHVNCCGAAHRREDREKRSLSREE